MENKSLHVERKETISTFMRLYFSVEKVKNLAPTPIVPSTQIEDILSGSKTIEGYTWHHNAQSAPNNMQLVPQPIHDAVKHIGQGSLSGGK